MTKHTSLVPQGAAPVTSSRPVRTQQSTGAADQNAAMAKLFNAYDVRETSHHLQITHLDLHICDDVHIKDRGSKVSSPRYLHKFPAMVLSFFFPPHDALWMPPLCLCSD